MALSESLPKTFQKLMVVKRSLNFREAVSVTTSPMPDLKPNEILVRNKYLGVNASDIIRSAGGYNPEGNVPFDVGLEGVGTIVATGKDVTKYKKDQHVCYIGDGAYSEYVVLSETKSSKSRFATPVVIKNPQPEYLAIAGISGLTAKMALDKCGELKSNEIVLVTAAAGGTGHLALQFAKQKGCHVIGTCSSNEKVSLLKSLGCDRVVNYKEEKLQAVLNEEYKNGIDVVFESIGGEMFNTALSSLAIGGRLLIIGFISGYKSGSFKYDSDLRELPRTLLGKSASVRGFYLLNFAHYFNEYMDNLVKEFESNNVIKAQMDNSYASDKSPLSLNNVIDAVEYLHSGKNVGKVYVTLP